MSTALECRVIGTDVRLRILLSIMPFRPSHEDASSPMLIPETVISLFSSSKDHPLVCWSPRVLSGTFSGRGAKLEKNVWKFGAFIS